MTRALGEREGIRRKPAPDSVNELLRTFGYRREESVYIGDSDVDIMTAENAGVDCISVDWGFRGRDFLRKSGAAAMLQIRRSCIRLLWENIKITVK